MAAFEASLHYMPIYVSDDIERDANEIRNVYYRNVDVNALFIAYMHGYLYAKEMARLNDMPLNE